MNPAFNLSFAQTFPDDEWSYLDDPAIQGWDPEFLEAYHDYIVDSSYITGLMIIQDGHVIFEYGDVKEKIATSPLVGRAYWPCSMANK